MAMTDETIQISAAEQGYLLAIRQSRGGPPLTGAELARRMSVSPQATSEMLRRLVSRRARDSLSEQRHVGLTDEGSRVADGIYRRHALAEWLLTSVLGISWAESDAEALRLQACISPRVEAALDELLGHPETCPHGNPIDEATARRRPVGEPLSDVDFGHACHGLSHHRGGRRGRRPALVPGSQRVATGQPGHRAGALRVDRFADARRSARAGHAGTPTGLARARAARRARPGRSSTGHRRAPGTHVLVVMSVSATEAEIAEVRHHIEADGPDGAREPGRAARRHRRRR